MRCFWSNRESLDRPVPQLSAEAYFCRKHWADDVRRLLTQQWGNLLRLARMLTFIDSRRFLAGTGRAARKDITSAGATSAPRAGATPVNWRRYSVALAC